ncbi:DNA repair protein RecN [Clostridium sp. BJN0001]|uniref:DNA repair protein RecN n=1 Tax=Clostridium sp. BJN0001 TaxID=2930219 RepID=UPI001FD364E3|nr:DNA repair protein RecN [Clostridium sp. BJN0001]
MLLQLNIRNFALISNLTVNFNEGFNILSGETGAGKSILIDAIDFVLGGKFSKNLIRTGEDKTYVEALFTVENSNIKNALSDLSIEYEDDMIIISRETHKCGKNILKINGKSVLTGSIKKLRSKILDIHGQHQNQNLMSKSNHILYLDDFLENEIKSPLSKFVDLKNKKKNIEDKIYEITKDEDREKILSFLKYQINDIKNASLKENEEEELNKKFDVLSNSEKINDALVSSYQNLSGNSESSILELLSKAISNLSEIEDKFESAKDERESLEGAYYVIQESARNIRDYAENVVYDKDEIEKINERIYEISGYKKKYGPTISDILKYYEEIKEKYEKIVNSEQILQKLNSERDSIIEDMSEISELIHNIRFKKASELEEKILSELKYVGLDKCRMKISVEKQTEFNERGYDDVSFLISTNPGEPLMNLEKVLSGGELSRIMLAMKCVFAEKDKIPTLIFDEIDTGISGIIAQRVGEKMYELSKTHQVLCITHLSQIAILSDYHYFVSKSVKEGKTYTQIKVLNKNEKEKEISKMLAGDDVTENTINSVREMIEKTEKRKYQISHNIYYNGKNKAIR